MKPARCLVLCRVAGAALVVGACAIPISSAAALTPERTDRSSHVAATVRGEQYEIGLEAAALKVGEAGAIVVTIVPKAGFKFNEQFPTKLSVEDPPDGLTFPAPTMKKADGKLDSKGHFTFRMPVSASRAGQFEVQTKLKFSVCTDEKCVVQRQVLTATLKAE